MSKEDARQFASSVHLRDARRPRAVVHRQFLDHVPPSMRARHELPPEALLHGTKFAGELLRHRPPDQ